VSITVELLRQSSLTTLGVADPARFRLYPLDPAQYAVLEEDDLPQRDDPAYPHLCDIDPYDDVIFSRAQMPAVIRELQLLLAAKGSDHVEAVLALAKRTAAEGGWLAFQGD
jgi:hypothetical protein